MKVHLCDVSQKLKHQKKDQTFDHFLIAMKIYEEL